MDFYILLVSFFLIALVYSSVGFGGGSSYLAMMGVLAISPEVMRPAALLCNIVVVTGGTFIYYKENLIEFKKSWPFLVASVPAAFLGGFWPISDINFFRLLGITLLVAAFCLWIQGQPDEKKETKSGSVVPSIAIGGGIGLLSGLVSIGGGIFLAPVLHFLRWENARKIAALASVFILVNSISGLVGKLIRSPEMDWKFILPLLIVVMAGGQIGSRMGARYFNILYIKRITAVLILVAGINILKDHF